jgi:hypothetical protein
MAEELKLQLMLLPVNDTGLAVVVSIPLRCFMVI